MNGKRALLVAAAILVSLVIYVLPHSLAVRQANAAWAQLQTQLGVVQGGLRDVTTLDACALSIAAIPDIATKLQAADARRVALTRAAHFPRSLVAHVVYSEADVTEARRMVDGLVSAVPGAVTRAVAQQAQAASSTLGGVTSLEAVRQTVGGVQKALEGVQQSCVRLLAQAGAAHLVEVYPSFASLDLGSVGSNRRQVQGMADAGVAAIGRLLEGQVATYRRQMESAPDMKSALTVADTEIVWLKSATQTLNQAAEFGASAAKVKRAARDLEGAKNDVRGDVELVSRIAASQKAANEQMRATLVRLDEANASLAGMQSFASSDQIRQVYAQWAAADEAAAATGRVLDVAVGSEHQRAVAAKLQARPRERLSQIQNEIHKHMTWIAGQYQEAARQESTLWGNATRTGQRGLASLGQVLGQIGRDVGNSRVGRELGLSTKMFVLGTKAFYDLLDPNTDVTTWAFAYSGDIDQLMQETDAISRMEGPSLTGKNTVFEQLIDSAYERSFHAPKP